MTYDTVATVSQVTTLLLFMTLFLVVIAYVFWPANRGKFERAARAALEPDKTARNGSDPR
jgi:cytochrome c oxidase cbb3-type subunit IV